MITAGFLFFNTLSSGKKNNRAASSHYNETDFYTDDDYLLNKQYKLNETDHRHTALKINSELTQETLNNYYADTSCKEIIANPDEYNATEILVAINTILTDENNEHTKDAIKLTDALIYSYRSIKDKYPKNTIPEEELLKKYADALYYFSDYTHIDGDASYFDNESDTLNSYSFFMTYDAYTKLYEFSQELEYDYTPLSMYLYYYIRTIISNSFASNIHIYTDVLENNPSPDDLDLIYNMHEMSKKNTSSLFYYDTVISTSTDNFDLYFKIKLDEYNIKIPKSNQKLPTKEELPLQEDLYNKKDYRIEKKDINSDGIKEYVYCYSDYIPTNEEMDIYTPLSAAYNNDNTMWGVVCFKYDSKADSYIPIPITGNYMHYECNTTQLRQIKSPLELFAGSYIEYSDAIIFNLFSKHTYT